MIELVQGKKQITVPREVRRAEQVLGRCGHDESIANAFVCDTRRTG
jgi:hypothetical protein